MCIMRLQYARFNNILVEIKLSLVLSDCLQLHNESKIEPYENPLIHFAWLFKKNWRSSLQLLMRVWETLWHWEDVFSSFHTDPLEDVKISQMITHAFAQKHSFETEWMMVT